MRFIKCECGGNDFVIFDRRKNNDLPKDLNNFVKFISDRKNGIGCDGVVIIEPCKDADFFLRFFNPDGSEYGVCGNGSLCVLLYEGKRKVKFNTISGTFFGENNKLLMLISKEIKFGINLDGIELNFVKIGDVPHSVIFTKNLEKLDIEKLAKPVRYHKYFAPIGTNVNFVEIISKDEIYVRTYEKGVENETISCGSGIVCSCIVGFLLGKLNNKVKVKAGAEYFVEIKSDNEIYLEGNPKIIFHGELVARPISFL